jgi:uncharacterized YccA/Bax inhibitor family protein
MRVGNNYVFKKAESFSRVTAERATMKGVSLKTVLLLLITIATAVVSMVFGDVTHIASGGIIMAGYILSPILTFVLSITMSLSPKTAKFLAVPYAILEGLSIGCLSIILMFVLGGNEAGMLLGLALFITISIFLVGAILYTTGIVKVTTKFRRFMFILLIGLVTSTFLISIISIFSSTFYTLFMGDSNISILISIISIVVASLYTLISFDNANSIVEANLDKDYEWYASFGIVLNIIWLFYEILRLLLIILSRSRNN